jgi:hypothetical protein
MVQQVSCNSEGTHTTYMSMWECFWWAETNIPYVPQKPKFNKFVKHPGNCRHYIWCFTESGTNGCICLHIKCSVQEMKPNKPHEQNFAPVTLCHINMNPGFLPSILFSDEATFHLTVKANQHNIHIWGSDNPHSY